LTERVYRDLGNIECLRTRGNTKRKKKLEDILNFRKIRLFVGKHLKVLLMLSQKFRLLLQTFSPVHSVHFHC